MKKLVAILLSLILVMGTLVGCGNGDDAEKDNENSEVSNDVDKSQGSGESKSWEELKAEIPESLKGTTVTVYSWNAMNRVDGAVEAIEEFENQTGIHVEWITAGYNEYSTLLSSMVASDEAPDVVRLRDADPAVIKILEPLENVDFDFTDEAWDQGLMEHYKMNDKHYAAVLKDSPYYQPTITYYNRTLIERYGLEDPYELWQNGEWTWTKMEEMIDTFLAAAGDQYYGASMNCGCDYAWSLGSSMISYNPETNAYESHIGDVNLTKGWQYTVKNVERGRFSETWYAYETFAAGMCLFYNDSVIDARNGHWYFAEMMDEGTLGTVPMPAIEGQDEYYVALSENEAYGIPTASKNKEAAAYFMRFYLDSENYDMSSFFCDDQAYEVVEWCRDQQYITSMEQRINGATCGEWNTQVHRTLTATGVQQIQSVLDSYGPVLQIMEDTCNQMISELE